ncbi:hypothetical protein [Sphingobacterium yanglingense]|uniref:Uncharacterized protein n=1 Tax=Sphingobacterium yanglingense TaxID=1437280 RepID=A0A4R6WNR2_9SPHI|nr:hypothetical protein [Sphingobacterium yanglingense]TDQ82583.1 hypothetical protein CLV99_0158 [Sphingobacterium yanglingense]
MQIDKATLVNIVLLIHMALTGIMLFRLFKLRNATGGQLILTFLALTVPVLGPSVMIWFYNKQLEKVAKKTPNAGKQKKNGNKK